MRLLFGELALMKGCEVVLLVGFFLLGLSAASGAQAEVAFPTMACEAQHTAGFHDHPGDDESYQASLFYPSRFQLANNAALALAMTGAPEAAELYLTLTLVVDSQDGEAQSPPPLPVELECRAVRGSGTPGYSCNNLPPSELLLINRETWRFTRTSVGGWTFKGATDNHSGDSIFVEYGSCVPGTNPAASAPTDQG